MKMLKIDKHEARTLTEMWVKYLTISTTKYYFRLYNHKLTKAKIIEKLIQDKTNTKTVNFVKHKY